MYLLDSNIFIQSNRLFNTFFGLASFEKFLAWLLEKNYAKAIYSINAVQKELLDTTKYEQGDTKQKIPETDRYLRDWVEQQDGAVFKDPLEDPRFKEVLKQILSVKDWDKDSYYKPSAIDEFSIKTTDAQLVAYAKCKSDTVVTAEKKVKDLHKDLTTKIKIPDVCEVFEVKCIDPPTMFCRKDLNFSLDFPSPK